MEEHLLSQSFIRLQFKERHFEFCLKFRQLSIEQREKEDLPRVHTEVVKVELNCETCGQ